MTIVKTVTKNVITRVWDDIEPKVIAFFATGLTASAVITAAGYIGWKDVTPGIAAGIVTVVGLIAGYFKHSTLNVAAPAIPVVAPAVQPTTINISGPVTQPSSVASPVVVEVAPAATPEPVGSAAPIADGK